MADVILPVYEYKTDTGVIVPSTGDVKTQVQNEYKEVFGTDLVLADNTPQGMLIAVETLARIAVAFNNANLANQLNPNLAGGAFLDAILALTGVERTVATPSTLTATLTGVAGTIIPSGARASETGSGDENIFETIGTVTIPDGGTLADVPFQSVANGPVPCDVGTLTVILSSVLGWETISTNTQAVLGQVTQSDTAARQKRRDTLFSQGSSLAGAMMAAVLETKGVTSMTFRENIADTTETIDGVEMLAHSVYACVAGGTDLAVATALVSKKSGGVAYSNDASDNPVSQNVTEPFSGQVMEVKFDRPDLIPVLARVTYKPLASIQDPLTAIRDAIMKYADGELDGEPGLVVGQSVSSFELAGAVNRQNPPLYVQKVEITIAETPVYSTAEIPIAIWEQATITAGSITAVPAS